jgi:hypothetical protein
MTTMEDERVYTARWTSRGSTYEQKVVVDPDEHPREVIGEHRAWVIETYGTAPTYTAKWLEDLLAELPDEERECEVCGPEHDDESCPMVPHGDPGWDAEAAAVLGDHPSL